MDHYRNFWRLTLLRGGLAIVAGSAILVVPDMARTLLFLPFAIALVILSLATYGIADSVLVFCTSFTTPLRSARAVLRVQAGFGALVGVLFCSIFFDRIPLHWFFYLIALQALATADAEFAIARRMASHHDSRWCYAAAGIALLCACGYGLAAALGRGSLGTHSIAWLAYAYLAAFGTAQTLMAARMLYSGHERRLVSG